MNICNILKKEVSLITKTLREFDTLKSQFDNLQMDKNTFKVLENENANINSLINIASLNELELLNTFLLYCYDATSLEELKNIVFYNISNSILEIDKLNKRIKEFLDIYNKIELFLTSRNS